MSEITEAPAQAEMSAEDAIATAKGSIDFLAYLLAPLVYLFAFPSFYRSLWQLLCTYLHQTRTFPQIALGLPRGFAKTFFVKLLVCYAILFTHKRFILIVSENGDKAASIVKDVWSMLRESYIVRLFGTWDSRHPAFTDRAACKIFYFRGRIIVLKGVGINAGIRGISEDNARPDLMIFDDIQSRADAESKEVSESLEREMYGTAMKAKSPLECTFIFIANMYPTKYSILRKIKQNPAWIKVITGGILEDGSSLWEELQPIEQLRKEFLNDFYSGNEQIFFAEVMNDENAQVFNSFDLTKLPKYPYEEDDILEAGWIFVDPSNDKATSDAVSIGAFGVIDNKDVCLELLEGQLSPKEIVKQSLKMAMKHGFTVVGYEANAFQYSLLFWHGEVCKELGITGIEAVDAYSGKSSKNSRIMRMLRSYMIGDIYCHPTQTPPFHSQITSFNPGKTDNTDGILDLFTYCSKMRELYPEKITRINLQLANNEEDGEVVDNNTAF